MSKKINSSYLIFNHKSPSCFDQGTEKSQNQSQKIVDRTPAIICTIDKNGRFVQVNDSVRHILGYTPGEMIHKNPEDFIHPDDVAFSITKRVHCFQDNEVRNFKNKYLGADGSEVYISWSARWDPEEELMYCVGVDVTDSKEEIQEKRNIQYKIRQAKEQYELVIGANRAKVYDWNIKTKKLYWGNNFESSAITDYSLDDWLQQVHPDDRERVFQGLKKALRESGTTKWKEEYRSLRKEGGYGWTLERATILRDEDNVVERMVGSLEDVTYQRQKDEQMQKSLEEKEVLLAEVHHRVKNNLAIISGLLQLEAFEEHNETVKMKLMEFVTRIHSIANVHEQLYKANSFSRINFSESLQSLVEKIMDTVQYDTAVLSEFELDPVQLNVNQAMPISMMVNEVITLTLKHSFKHLKKGAIKAELREHEGEVTLKIIDDGEGLTDIFQSGESKPLSLQLIEQLAKQLRGHYCYKHLPEGGAQFSMTFKKANKKGVSNACL